MRSSPRKRLHDEIADDAAVVGVHPRAVRVEDADHLDVELVLPLVVEEQRLGAALALVVAAARADRVHVAPVALGLRVHLGIAVHLGRRRLQDARLHALGEAQHVDRAVHARLRRLHRVELVVDRRGGARQVEDLVDLDVERERHVVAHQLEARVAQEVRDVALGPREEVVDAKDVVAALDEPFAKMRAEEAGAPGHQRALVVGAHGRPR